MGTDAGTFDPAESAEVLFLPLADPERRHTDPLRALTAARDLEMILGSGREAAVLEARRAGHSWAEIGERLGLSKQGAQQRWGPFVSAMGAAAED